jgi:hypothetical protein
MSDKRTGRAWRMERHMESRTILEEFRFYGSNNTAGPFVVRGRRGRPVALFTQQARALNLVWALAGGTLEGKKLVGKSVVVVGGGVAGLTAATAAAVAGAKVTVLEQMSELMPLQRGCHHRFLHPRFFDWPHRMAGMAAAPLPLLDWTADTAARVADQIIEGFWRIADLVNSKEPEIEEKEPEIEGSKKEEKTKRLKIRMSVREIKCDQKDPPWTLTYRYKDKEGEDAPGKDECNVLILAPGFGLEERTVPGLPARSYWRSDPMDQPNLSPSGVYRVLVAGTGDGGIIDLLRARLENFDHGPVLDRFIFLVAKEKKIQDGLREAEAKANKAFDPKSSRDEFKRAAAESLLESYKKLRDEPRALLWELEEYLTKLLRPNVEVCWLGEISDPLNIEAFPIHRVLGWLLVAAGKVTYKQSTLEWVDCDTPSRATAASARRPGVKWEGALAYARDHGKPKATQLNGNWHEVVVRYGAILGDDNMIDWLKSPLHAWVEAPGLERQRELQYPLPEAVDYFHARIREVSAKPSSADGTREPADQTQRPCLKAGAATEVRKSTADGEPWPCYQIWLQVENAPPATRRIDYILHPEHEEVRRSAECGPGKDFLYSIFTHDDYWVKAKTDTDAEITGEWLSILLKDTQPEIAQQLQKCAERLRNVQNKQKQYDPDKLKEEPRPPAELKEWNQEMAQQLNLFGLRPPPPD